MEQTFLLSPPTTQTVLALRQASLIDGQILGGHYIKSVLVDNPTGSWLLLSADNTWIPPYKIGWAHNLDQAAFNVSITFEATGPAGQGSTILVTTGSAVNKVRVTLSTDEVTVSGGSDSYGFVTNLEQPETLLVSVGGSVGIPTNPSTVTTAILGGQPKRLRLFEWHLLWDLTAAGPVGTRMFGTYMATIISSPTANFSDTLFINTNNMYAYKVFSPPQLLPVGSEIQCQIYRMIETGGLAGTDPTPVGIGATVRVGIM